MSHTVRDKKKLLTRLKKIQGQSTALEKMLNREHECAEILQQLAAIRGAVDGMMLQVIQGHLTDHVVKEPDGTQREADLETVMQVIKSYLKLRPLTFRSSHPPLNAHGGYALPTE